MVPVSPVGKNNSNHLLKGQSWLTLCIGPMQRMCRQAILLNLNDPQCGSATWPRSGTRNAANTQNPGLTWKKGPMRLRPGPLSISSMEDEHGAGSSQCFLKLVIPVCLGQQAPQLKNAKQPIAWSSRPMIMTRGGLGPRL